MILKFLAGLLLLCPGLHGQNANCTGVLCSTNAECRNGECECGQDYFSPTGSNDDCRSSTTPVQECESFDSNCIFCGTSSQGPCMWCTRFVNQDSKCIANCSGDSTITITPISTIGRTILQCDEADSGGSSSSIPQWAIIVIIVVVIVIVILVAAVVVIAIVQALQRTSRGVFEIEGGGSPNGTMRTKRSSSFSFTFNKSRKTSEDLNALQPSAAALSQTHGLMGRDEEEDEDDDDDRIDGDDETVFKHKVEQLKPKSEIFLQMLNDMRRRSRDLPEDSPAEEQYRKVIRDVTRLLYILNKKPSRLQMPPDGLELMKWSKKILRKYESTQEREGSATPEPSYMSSGPTGTSDESVFLGKLAFLSDHADVFLRMLNELRRKLKGLRPELSITRNYKAIMKDLARLLEFINKDPDKVRMPADGLRLVDKAETLLENYLAGQGFDLNYEEDRRYEQYAEDTTTF